MHKQSDFTRRLFIGGFACFAAGFFGAFFFPSLISAADYGYQYLTFVSGLWR